MALTLNDVSLPALTQTLRALSAILAKAADYAASHKVDESVLLNARLYPDMFAFARQVQIATDLAKGCAARLAGVDIPRYEDDETTIAQLQARIARTIDFLDSFTPAQIDAGENAAVVLQLRERALEFTGRSFVLSWVLPNFYFHATTAYDILRHNGVELGKKDFLGA